MIPKDADFFVVQDSLSSGILRFCYECFIRVVSYSSWTFLLIFNASAVFKFIFYLLLCRTLYRVKHTDICRTIQIRKLQYLQYIQYKDSLNQTEMADEQSFLEDCSSAWFSKAKIKARRKKYVLRVVNGGPKRCEWPLVDVWIKFRERWSFNMTTDHFV